MTAYRPMLMRAATVVQQLCKSCTTCFKFYCMFYFTCDRSIKRSSDIVGRSVQSQAIISTTKPIATVVTTRWKTTRGLAITSIIVNVNLQWTLKTHSLNGIRWHRKCSENVKISRKWCNLLEWLGLYYCQLIAYGCRFIRRTFQGHLDEVTTEEHKHKPFSHYV